MTLTTEPRAPERFEEPIERADVPVEPPASTPDRRIRWFEWATGAIVLVLMAVAATLLITQGSDQRAEADSTLVIGPRHFGVVYVPEYVGQSGGDLTAIESSPLVIGPRHVDGVVFLPEYVGQSGGDLAAIESSPLVIGVRHLDGVVYLPEYVGHAGGSHPEDSR